MFDRFNNRRKEFIALQLTVEHKVLYQYLKERHKSMLRFEGFSFLFLLRSYLTNYLETLLFPFTQLQKVRNKF